MDGHTVFPVEHAGGFDSPLRKLFQNPERILASVVQPGMRVMDVGCGPGYFTLPLARMVGPTGRVFAVDVQQGMLDIVAAKIARSELKERIALRCAAGDGFGVDGTLDFVLAFYMVHEVDDLALFLAELRRVMRDGARVLIVEPLLLTTARHVRNIVELATTMDFVAEGPGRVRLARSVVLRKEKRVR